MKRCSTTWDIPHVSGHPTARPDDASHFRNRPNRVGQIRDNEGHDRDIEAVLAKRQRVGVANPEFGWPCSRPRSRKSELPFRWIDRDDFARSTASDNCFGERGIAAAHVEPPEIRWNVEPVQENLAGEAAPTPHQSLVGVSIGE